MTNRLLALPRRDWRARSTEAAGLNALLRQPGGTETLFDIQAVSLLELFECDGLFCAARTGAGKTKIIGLAPTLMALKGYTRPLIAVPGSLLKDTEAKFRSDRVNWKIANQYWLESYNALARESRADVLEERQPDLLLFDEPDRPGGLRKILTAACAKRVGRYIASRRSRGEKTACAFFTGTPERDGILDFAHMVLWALGEAAPLSLDPVELQQWSAWLDQGDTSGRVAFSKYFGPASVETQEASWGAFRERVISTPGVIVSDDEFDGAGLELQVYRVDPGLDREFEQLRTLWQRPDGWQLLDADEGTDPDDVNTWSIWGIARQLALGFFYVADPPPPKDWAAARKAYADYVRALIDAPHSKFDTEKQVRNACEKSTRKIVEWETWKGLKDTFKPRSRPVWVSTHALDAAKAWGSRAPGIIWVDHLAFGERLSAETGWPFYGQCGLDAAGRSIEQSPAGQSVIASRLANQTGRNLQTQFSRNLIMAMPNAASDIQQLIARTHRYGQTQAKVSVDVYACCAEHDRAVEKCQAGARKTQGKLGLSQKVLGVDCVVHGDVPVSWAWR